MARGIMFGSEEGKVTRNLVDVKNIMSIKGADDILHYKEYQDKISELKSKSGLSFALFEEHYWHLITNLTNYMQLLPDPRQKNYPILHVALARARIAFEHVVNCKDQRFQYAYVALALFSDLGICLTDYDVLICDIEGEVLDQWHPLVRGLSDYTGYFYKIRPTNLYPRALRFDVNVILACSIMPEFGLFYIREDPLLFSQWLRALSGKDDCGGFSAVLDTTKAFSKSDLINNLDPSLVSADMCGDAEEFWVWLQRMLIDKENYDLQNGIINIDLDALIDKYAKESKKEASSIKRRLQQIDVLKSVNSKITSNAVGSMFFGGSGKEKTVNNSKINKSVNAGKNYIKLASSLTESKDKFESAKAIAQQQNQQST